MNLQRLLRPAYRTEDKTLSGVTFWVTVSVLLHAGLLFCYRRAEPTIPPMPNPPSALTVFFLPKSTSEPQNTPTPVPRSNARNILSPAAKTPLHPTQKQDAPTPAAPAASASEAAHETTKTIIDMEAALSTARKMANEPDPKRIGMPVEQLRRNQTYPDTSATALARNMEMARRPDCKDGVPGGLLAPIYLMMDKKDSGCKW